MMAAPTVIQPATATERLLIAPSTLPISIAFEVPITCEAVPMAMPFAIGFFMPSRRQSNPPAMFSEQACHHYRRNGDGYVAVKFL